ncbi:MAG TPA: M1 family aminopeptidase [Terracidiphilus sp.]|jgi:hypothetical protein|nr:M1 family aminopeptidase [Terracidiphilus sp.]
MRDLRGSLLFVLLVSCAAHLLPAQQEPNKTSIYQQLRTLSVGEDVVSVTNLQLHRDAATFTFSSGNFAFYRAVNGKVTGAVFRGSGHIHVAPPSAEERHNLAVLNKAEEFDEDFDQAVLRFTDNTSDELHHGASGKGAPDTAFAHEATEFHNFQRLKLSENFDLRLLEDVLSPKAAGYFLAYMRGKKNAHLVFTVDAHGASGVSPEEVSLLSWSDDSTTYLSAFPSKASEEARAAGHDEDNGTYLITHEDLDVSIEKNGFLTGLATVHLTSLQDGVAVVRLALFPALRVSKVEDDKSARLDFVQEKKDEDADFGVVLGHPLNKGESATLRVTYGGKDVVHNEGNANYYPVARESWYPNEARGLGDYATYAMTFHVPKGLQLIATGTRVNESTDGKVTTSTWKTDVPLAVVGFSLGMFKMKEGMVPGKLGDNLTIDAYANTAPPEDFEALQGGAVGNFDTPGMLPVQLSQGQAAAQLYIIYFGSLPFSRVALTQQFACDYGQSWPMLVYLPICGFLDTTQQHVLGLNPEDMYWKVVTAHEVAHQWWGQTVGFRSYRDQWMSEGFAVASSSIYLQSTRSKTNDFRDFWKQQRRLLTDKNAFGLRPIDMGPVTMGFRLATQKTGWNVYQDLVYPKGAYILHMIRMMMWSRQDGDARFIEMMHDFVATYRLKSATTEDFKAMVEKHMSPAMDLDGNQRMDWFFNQYVYGTQIPTLHFEAPLTQQGDVTTVNFKLTQSGVADNFKMMVPVYFELADGRVVRSGSFNITGDRTIEQSTQLPKMQTPLKRVLIDYNYDVLAIEN